MRRSRTNRRKKKTVYIPFDPPILFLNAALQFVVPAIQILTASKNKPVTGDPIITEDADFEIIQPKQLNNDSITKQQL